MQFIDTHTHLYQPDFDEDRNEAIERCVDVGINRLLLPNIDLESVPRVLEMMRLWPKMCFGMMGLHPCHVKEGWEKDLVSIQEILDSPPDDSNFIAVGEIGLDLYWDQSKLDIQKKAFRIQVDWAKERDLPIVIHVREAWDELFSIMDEVCDDRLRGVFHCFSGSEVEAKRALEYDGFMLGVGGVSTFKNGGLDKVLPNIDLEKLLLETDSPYLAPVPFRGKRNESSYLVQIAERLAFLKGVSLVEVARVTTENAEQLFRLSSNN